MVGEEVVEELRRINTVNGSGAGKGEKRKDKGGKKIRRKCSGRGDCGM